MGYQFKLRLNRVITGEEFAALGEAGWTGAAMTAVSLPLDDSVVTRIDVDTEAANLAEAIQAGLDAVQAVPDLTVGALEVPPQPSGLPDEGGAEGESGGKPAALTAGSASDGAGPAPGAGPAENAAVVADAAAKDAGPAANGETSPKRKSPASECLSEGEDERPAE